MDPAMTRAPSLSQRRLRAIAEALRHRLAGEIEDVGDLKIEDYRKALVAVQSRLTPRSNPAADVR